MTQFLTIEIKKPIIQTVFTHILTESTGWKNTSISTKDFDTVTFIGTCKKDGDMFACDTQGTIEILKGTKGDEFN